MPPSTRNLQISHVHFVPDRRVAEKLFVAEAEDRIMLDAIHRPLHQEHAVLVRSIGRLVRRAVTPQSLKAVIQFSAGHCHQQRRRQARRPRSARAFAPDAKMPHGHRARDDEVNKTGPRSGKKQRRHHDEASPAPTSPS